ncbi:MAG: hypothetical protein KR126chlam6_01144 [Candidatus Anoxychlamydiales bacterium]|nr:hypothetical protein [Candidatus Anoxychlamydiales bacterium]
MKTLKRKKLVIFFIALNLILDTYICWAIFTYIKLSKPQEYVKNGIKVNYEFVNPKFSFFLPLKIRAEKLSYKREEFDKDYKSIVFNDVKISLLPFWTKQLVASKAVGAMVSNVNQKGMKYINVTAKASDIDIKFNGLDISSLFLKNLTSEVSNLVKINIDKYSFDMDSKKVNFDIKNMGVQYLKTLSGIPPITVDNISGYLSTEPSMKRLNNIWKKKVLEYKDGLSNQQMPLEMLKSYLDELRNKDGKFNYCFEISSSDYKCNFTSLLDFKNRKANGKIDFIVNASTNSQLFPTLFASMNNLPWNLKAKNLEMGKWQVSLDVEDDMLKNENRNIASLDFLNK